MNITFGNINFKGLQKPQISKRPFVTNSISKLDRDVFESLRPKNFTVENQKKLSDAKFDKESVSSLVKTDLDLDNIIKLGKLITNNKTENLKFVLNKYGEEDETFVISSMEGEKNKTSITANKKGEILSKETYSVQRYNSPKITDNYTAASYLKIQSEDYRNNMTSEIIADWDSRTGREVVLSEVKIKKDKQGKEIRKEITEKSSIPNVYNVKYEFPNGKTRHLVKASYDEKTGITTVKKDMRSSDMTRTQYFYQDDKNGNRIVDYKITDVNGKVLMNDKQTFEKISDNKFVSSRNDKIYDITLENQTLSVSERNSDKKADLKLDMLVFGHEKSSVMNMLKEFSGNELMLLADRVNIVETTHNDFNSKCETSMDIFNNGKTISKLLVSDNPAVFLHELGHAIDSSKKDATFGKNFQLEIQDALCEDEQFKEIYKEEKKGFLKEYPEAQRNYIDYFIADEPVKGQKDRGRKEIIAESNVVLNTYNMNHALAIRTQYMQQHFPKTIAYLSEKLLNV